MARSVFQTGTFKAASLGSTFAAIALVTPFASNIAQRWTTDQRVKDTIADVANLIMAVTGTAGVGTTVLGVAVNRASATDRVYTPGNLIPGFNKEDCVKPLSVEALPKPDMHEQVGKIMSQSVESRVEVPSYEAPV
jgi:hypothetical protein